MRAKALQTDTFRLELCMIVISNEVGHINIIIEPDNTNASKRGSERFGHAVITIMHLASGRRPHRSIPLLYGQRIASLGWCEGSEPERTRDAVANVHHPVTSCLCCLISLESSSMQITILGGSQQMGQVLVRQIAVERSASRPQCLSKAERRKVDIMLAIVIACIDSTFKLATVVRKCRKVPEAW